MARGSTAGPLRGDLLLRYGTAVVAVTVIAPVAGIAMGGYLAPGVSRLDAARA
jgi:hypothetical protein